LSLAFEFSKLDYSIIKLIILHLYYSTKNTKLLDFVEALDMNINRSLLYIELVSLSYNNNDA